MAEWGFTHIEIRNDYRCLDIGCGGGANVKKLLVKTPYGNVIGIDYSEVSVIKSSKINKAEIENKHCEILQGNVMKLPFRKETFDIITAFETIYFWPDINEAFKQVYRVLKVSGTFMICNESNGENSKEEKWTKIIQGMKIYNSEQIKKYLEDDIMGGIIFGLIVLVIGGLFTLAEDHKTSKMSEDERWEYEWKKAKKGR